MIKETNRAVSRKSIGFLFRKIEPNVRDIKYMYKVLYFLCIYKSYVRIIVFLAVH